MSPSVVRGLHKADRNPHAEHDIPMLRNLVDTSYRIGIGMLADRWLFVQCALLALMFGTVAAITFSAPPSGVTPSASSYAFFALLLSASLVTLSIPSLAKQANMLLHEQTQLLYRPVIFTLSQTLSLFLLLSIPTVIYLLVSFFVADFDNAAAGFFASWLALLSSTIVQVSVIMATLCVTANWQAAAMFVHVFVVFFNVLLAGFAAHASDVSPALRWIAYLCHFQHAHESIVVATNSPRVSSDSLLDNTDTAWAPLAVLLSLLVVWRIILWLCIHSFLGTLPRRRVVSLLSAWHTGSPVGSGSNAERRANNDEVGQRDVMDVISRREMEWHLLASGIKSVFKKHAKSSSVPPAAISVDIASYAYRWSPSSARLALDKLVARTRSYGMSGNMDSGCAAAVNNNDPETNSLVTFDLLHQVAFDLPSSSFTTIIGPSDAGRLALLDALPAFRCRAVSTAVCLSQARRTRH